MCNHISLNSCLGLTLAMAHRLEEDDTVWTRFFRIFFYIFVMFDIDLVNITCFRQVYVMVPGLFATNDTVWICPLKSSKVSTPTTSMT
jgi:hypothetical protein